MEWLRGCDSWTEIPLILSAILYIPRLLGPSKLPIKSGNEEFINEPKIDDKNRPELFFIVRKPFLKLINPTKFLYLYESLIWYKKPVIKKLRP